MPESLDLLRREFTGSIAQPGDPEYETARRTAIATGAPTAVLRPADVADVQRAVTFSAGSGLPLAVRGGGHSFAGLGTVDAGIVIDLAALNAVDVGDDGVVRVGGGATWGAVAAALAPRGLVLSSGDTASVGVGGLTLSGGIGWMVRRHGLALDSLLAVEVVTADGAVVPADRERHPDLFWAVRGGGGAFGVVTRFDFQAHPGGDLWFGTITFPASEAAAVLAGWAEHMRTAPDELSSTVKLANPFTGGAEAPVELVVAFDGDETAATAAIDPLRRLGTVLSDGVARCAYSDILEPGAVLPPGLRLAVRNAFVEQASAPATLALLADIAAEQQPAVITIHALGGAFARVPADSTAFVHRAAALMVTTFAGGPDAVMDRAEPALAGLWKRIAPLTSGAYANFLSTATAADAAAVYPADTASRLATVKAMYDPHDLFARTRERIATTPSL
ncbi:FAD-binding oxidoreductase [Leifsonia sp. NPDC058292]|uniref:FAD-binding oxidoreductase n=1 Tax=Leifsonia sp. NPDC058292 TaxID=3346428 RepID=UPI0036DA2FA4